MKMWNWLVDKLIAFAKRTPYFHLQHADGSSYMERYWVVRLGRRWNKDYGLIGIRLHHILTPDLDRVLHDHPWAFISVVLRGWYIEHRPVTNSPCFDGEMEKTYRTIRLVRSIAFRWWTDRHRITTVSTGGVWTLFVTFPKMQWWGFYTRLGKIYYQDYNSVHGGRK